MKNREELLKKSQYDVLCEMNQNLIDASDAYCIMSCFMDNIKSTRRCLQYGADECGKCIADWLGEEV